MKLMVVVVYGNVEGVAFGLSDFVNRRSVNDTLAEEFLFRHPISVLRRWTILEEARKLREVIRG